MLTNILKEIKTLIEDDNGLLFVGYGSIFVAVIGCLKMVIDDDLKFGLKTVGALVMGVSYIHASTIKNSAPAFTRMRYRYVITGFVCFIFSILISEVVVF